MRSSDISELVVSEPGVNELKDTDLKMDKSKMDESKMDESKMDKSKMDESKMDELKMDESKMDESKMDESKMDESNIDEPKIVEDKMEDLKIDEPKMVESKIDESKMVELKTKPPVVESNREKTPWDHMIWEEDKYKNNDNIKINVIKNNFLKYFFISFLFGVLYAFCFYQNPRGITFPLLTAGVFGCFWAGIRLMEKKIKSDSWFLVVVSMMLSISVCRTDSDIIIGLNKLGIILLSSIFLIHQFYEDKTWNIGKYLGAVLNLMVQSLLFLPFPFCHGSLFFKGIDLKKYKKVIMVLTGVVIAVPLLMFLIILLAAADAVFGSMVTEVFQTFFNLKNLLVMFLMVVFGLLVMYCSLCAVGSNSIREDVKQVRSGDPIIAITVMGLVSILYVVFSGIQILFLFLGKGTLPDGMTYSSYARQGFFQLLAVVILNVIMVLSGIKYFKFSRVLNVILLLISASTYVMAASAAYRMILYIREYQMTFQRILVLWFLAMAAVLMVGVIILILKNGFPLFQYCLVVISVFYVGFSWIKPDLVIAQYNIDHTEKWTVSDISYLVNGLSLDAAPAVMELFEIEMEKGNKVGQMVWVKDGDNWIEWYSRKISERTEGMGVRTYHFSGAKAADLFREKYGEY